MHEVETAEQLVAFCTSGPQNPPQEHFNYERTVNTEPDWSQASLSLRPNDMC